MFSMASVFFLPFRIFGLQDNKRRPDYMGQI